MLMEKRMKKDESEAVEEEIEEQQVQCNSSTSFKFCNNVVTFVLHSLLLLLT